MMDWLQVVSGHHMFGIAFQMVVLVVAKSIDLVVVGHLELVEGM